MSATFASVQFWAAVIVVLIFQAAKFGEFSTPDTEVNRRLAAIPDLRANDFADVRSYNAAFVAFLVASLLVFSLVCILPPELLRGILKVFNADLPLSEGDYGSYPIYISALYIALSQTGLPYISSAGNLQRKFFHYWIGIPNKIVQTSEYFSSQVAVKSEADIGAVVLSMTDDHWIGRLKDHADLVFYRDRLQNFEAAQALDSSGVAALPHDDLVTIAERLILIACLSVVRKSGGRGLSELARVLDVEMPKPRREPRKGAFAAAILLSGLVAAVLSSILPSLGGVVRHALPQAGMTLWPASRGFAFLAVISHVLPLMIVVLAVSLARPIERLQSSDSRWYELRANLIRFAPLVLVALGGLVLFDLVKGFVEIALFQKLPVISAADFLLRRSLIYFFHALNALVVLFMLLSFFSDRSATKSVICWFVLFVLLPLAASVASFEYSSLVIESFSDPLAVPEQAFNGDEYTVLLSILTAIASLLALAVMSFFYVGSDKTADAGKSSPYPYDGAAALPPADPAIPLR